MADWVSLLQNGPKPEDIGQAFQQGQADAIALRNAQIANQQKQQLFAQQQTARSRVADYLKNGDMTGAAAQLFAAGDDKGGTGLSTLDKQHYDQGAAGAGAFGEIVRGIASLPYEQRRSALESAKPTLSAMGYKPEQVDAFDPTDANLSAVGGIGYSAAQRAGDAIGQQNANINQQNADTQRIQANNPVVVNGSLVTRDGKELFRAPQYLESPMGSSLYEAPGVATVGSDGARADRNNNSGNLRWDGKSKWQGMTGVDKDGFVIFDTPANGDRALGINLMNQTRLHGLNTVSQIITKFAPQSDGNNTAAYIANVAAKLGVDPNAPIDLKNPQVRSVMMAAVQGHEGGGHQVEVSRSPQLIKAGVDTSANGPNSFDPNDPAIDQEAIKYLSTGKMSGLGNGNAAYRRAILNRSAQIAQERGLRPEDLSRIQSDYEASTKSLGNLQKQADFIRTSESNALGAAQNYIEFSKLAGGQDHSRPVNAIINGYKRQTNDPNIAQMDAAYQTFITEYARVVHSTPTGAGVLTDAARSENMRTLNSNASLAAKQAAIAAMTKDMKVRTTSYDNQIARVQGHLANMIPAKPSGFSIPPAAVAALRSGKGTSAQFDQIFGQGAAARALAQ